MGRGHFFRRARPDAPTVVAAHGGPDVAGGPGDRDVDDARRVAETLVDVAGALDATVRQVQGHFADAGLEIDRADRRLGLLERADHREDDAEGAEVHDGLRLPGMRPRNAHEGNGRRARRRDVDVGDECRRDDGSEGTAPIDMQIFERERT